MSGMLPVRFRPTPRQVLGRAIRIGLMTAAVVAVPVAVLWLFGSLTWHEALLLPAACLIGALVAAPLLRRGGVEVDERGLRPILPGPARRRGVDWHQIRDIRAERRGARTVPVVHRDGGRSWRLRVPYDGPLLSRDPRFDEKLYTIRSVWETYRRDVTSEAVD